MAALNLALLAGSAWLVYTGLAPYRRAGSAPIQLGTPRLLLPPAAAPSTATGREKLRPSPRPRVQAVTAKMPVAPKLRPVAPKLRPVAPKLRPVTLKPRPAALKTTARAASRDAGVKVARPAASPDAGAAGRVDRRRAEINAESIRLVVRHRLPQVRACHERATKRGQSIGGMIEVRLVIDETGKVRRAQVHSNTTGAAGLGVCIAATMERWKFPRPVGGEVEFIYPFVFSSSR